MTTKKTDPSDAARRNRQRLIWFTAAFLCAMAAAAAAICAFAFSGRVPVNTGGAVQETVLTNFTDDLGVETQLQFTTISLERADLSRGSLVLVNQKNKWSGGRPDTLVNVYDNRGEGYQLSGSNLQLQEEAMAPLNEMMAAFHKITGFENVMVAGCYRSETEQTDVYNEAVEYYTTEEVQRIVAPPGQSDYHTGYGVDLSLYTGGKVMDFLGTEDCAWLLRNCGRYGFVLRYPEGKEEITGYEYQPWHLRYVGRPHAYLMQLKQYCLEEYLEYVAHYPFAGNHIQVTDNQNRKYEIYYVSAQGEHTDVPVPTDREYTVSGDNRAGFIVTVQL